MYYLDKPISAVRLYIAFFVRFAKFMTTESNNNHLLCTLCECQFREKSNYLRYDKKKEKTHIARDGRKKNNKTRSLFEINNNFLMNMSFHIPITKHKTRHIVLNFNAKIIVESVITMIHSRLGVRSSRSWAIGEQSCRGSRKKS